MTTKTETASSPQLRAAREIAERAKLYAEAVAASERACAARAALDIGTSRARVTTANARWMSAAENRDRAEARLIEALDVAGLLAVVALSARKTAA